MNFKNEFVPDNRLGSGWSRGRTWRWLCRTLNTWTWCSSWRSNRDSGVRSSWTIWCPRSVRLPGREFDWNDLGVCSGVFTFVWYLPSVNAKATLILIRTHLLTISFWQSQSPLVWKMPLTEFGKLRSSLTGKKAMVIRETGNRYHIIYGCMIPLQSASWIIILHINIPSLTSVHKEETQFLVWTAISYLWHNSI